MNLHQVAYVVFFLAVAITVEAEEETGSVSFQNRIVTLTCPYDDDSESNPTVKWQKIKDSTIQPSRKSLTLEEYTEKNDGLYSCSSGEKTHYFYIKAKVCEGCVDLDITWVLVVVFADVLVTLMIVFAVYFCNRKKAGTAGPQRPTQARQVRPQGRGPPIPDPDYQPLNPTTRSGDVYATAHRR